MPDSHSSPTLSFTQSPRRPLGVGIDYGTTNSVAAFFDGQRLELFDLEPASPLPSVIPSALYFDRQYHLEVGWAAVEKFLSDNANRRVRLTREEVGVLQLAVGVIDGYYEDHVKVTAFTDPDLPSRLFRSIKSWLGEEELHGITIFERTFHLVALVTPLIHRIRQEIEAQSTLASDDLAPHIGRPVQYHGGGASSNTIALRRMQEACSHAGIPEATPYPEPLAATLSYLWTGKLPANSTCLTFDFGGGTLDLSVVRERGGQFDILATHGLDLGGDHLDQEIYRQIIFPELGEGVQLSAMSRDGFDRVPFPFADFGERLLIWQHAHELNQNERRERILQGMQEGGEVARKLRRLLALISGNHSYRVLQAIEQAKRQLSEAPSSRIAVPEIDLTIDLDRADLARIAAPFMRKAEGTVRQTLDLAGCSPEAIDAVVCTGGSSRLPPVREMLESIFPGRLVEHDPFTGIASGLAIANYFGFESP